MNTSRKLITNACILSLDEGVGDLISGDILIEGERIAAIGPNLKADDAEVIDASTMIAVPGFVDGHRHSWQSTLRGVISDMGFMEYITTVNMKYGPLHTPEDKYIGVLATCVTALDAGVTSLVEFSIATEGPEDADATVGAMKESGIRGFYCHGTPSDWGTWYNGSDLRHPAEEARRVRATHFASDDALIRFGMALRGPEFVSAGANRDDFQLARELGARITLHVDGPGHLTGMRDYMGPDTCYVHCSRCDDLDLELIRDTGGHINITAECEMGFHNAPITKKILEMGMKPSLGVDGGGVNSPDMFMQMRFALQELRMRYFEESWRTKNEPLWMLPFTSKDALGWGTLEGARQFGMEDQIGSLTPGKRADIVLIRHDSVHMSPTNNPVALVVDTASARDVDTVIVNGTIKKRHGKLLDVDMERIRKSLYEARDRIFAKGGIPRGSELALPYRPTCSH